ncbi:DMT family transporter [Hoeflea prorocentri]|uniref:DMT family transporter n=1 Tax=Hoeflea prorocentri TaxID=1922333 RepID=A0A9X3UFY4_9HYPH|nr:DMT family transporter [Hoeflea prorocentri]MCY6379884.1 DMT family transporter [Hoeflea prorocentri]MDA5397684.1 DMT family transporter [Hoeflea prorocentri]
MQSNNNTISATTWLLLFMLGAIWGASFFFTRVAVEYIPPLTLVFLRVFLAAIALHIYLIARNGGLSAIFSRWRDFLLLGLTNNVIPFSLLFFGQTAIGAGLASILNATTPLWTILIANVLTSDEKMTAAKVAGCLLGLAGTAVLIGPSALTGLGAPVWAQLFVVGAAVSYGLAATFGKRFSDLRPTVTATGQLTASSLIMLPVVVFFDRPWTIDLPPFPIILAVVALAVVSTSFAYILYFRIISTAGATNASLVTLIVPPSAIVLGALFLNETLSLEAMAGLILIGIGLLTIDGRFFRIMKRK